MKREDRKAAVAAYKEAKIEAGIVVMRCVPTGEAWVGATPNVGAIENRLRFTLKMGNGAHASLLVAWKAHGEDAFTVQTLEVIETDDTGRFRQLLMNERAAHWMAELGAQPLF